MKLRNFLLLAGGLAALGIGGATMMCSSDKEEAPKESGAEPEAVVATEPTKPEVETMQPLVEDTDGDTEVDNSGDGETTGLRDVDNELMSWIGKDLGSKKRKDAVKGNAWKINLYQDAGKTAMNRAKVDLDRDDKWDEKWTFDGKNISRKVSPADDENYSEEFDWSGSDWTAR